MGLPFAVSFGVALFIHAPTFNAQPSLEAVAAASSRPRECGSLGTKGRMKKASVWRRARIPELTPYCELVAKAHASIEADPAAALAFAQKAEEVWPKHAGALVTQGRALVALGKTKEALEKLLVAQEIDGRSVEEPKAMHALARAFIANGKIREGAEVYRALVPRGSLLADRVRTRVLLEAALAAMTEAAMAKDGGARPMSESLAESIAFIQEARSSNEGGALEGDVLLAAALIYDRAGDAEKATVALAEAGRRRALPGQASSYVASSADVMALEALSKEPTSVDDAKKAWEAYLAASKEEAFAASARARLASLSGKGPAGKGPPKKKRAKGP